jgi:hypothetical protein
MLYSIGSHYYCSFLNSNAYELRYGKSENFCTTKMNPLHLHHMMKELKGKKKAEKKNMEKNVSLPNVDNTDVHAAAQTLSMEERTFLAERLAQIESNHLPAHPEGVRTSVGVCRYYVAEVGLVPESEYGYKWSEKMFSHLRSDDRVEVPYDELLAEVMADMNDKQPWYYMSAAKAQGMSCLNPDTSDEPRIV